MLAHATDASVCGQPYVVLAVHMGLSSHQTPPSKVEFKRSELRQFDGLACAPNTPRVLYLSSLKSASTPSIFISFIFGLYPLDYYCFLISHKIIIFFNFTPFYFYSFRFDSHSFDYYFLLLINYKIIFFQYNHSFFLSFKFNSHSFYYYLFCLRSFFRCFVFIISSSMEFFSIDS